MRAIRVLCLSLLLLLPTAASAQDAINLRQVIIHNSPDVTDWPATVHLDGLTMSPTDGLSFTAQIPDTWDYHIPGWGTGTTCPADGCILDTVWAVARVHGLWRTAGFIQMWKGRPSTGAPILSEYRNWWGDGGSATAGVFGNYVPQAGDEMGFFLTAGNARAGSPWGGPHERSNIVRVVLPAGDTGTWSFANPVPTPEPTPTPTPTPPPTPAPDLGPVLARLGQVEAAVVETRTQLGHLQTQLQDIYTELIGRVQALEVRPNWVDCRARIFGLPVSCSLVEAAK